MGEKIPYTGLPTENPNSTITPGKMRSDREEIPGGFSKEQADRAEVREYELQQIKLQQQQAAARAIPAPGPDCSQYWPTEFWVCGAIRDKYNSLGAQWSFLTWPTSEELVNPDGFGRRQTFQNGPIYWSAASGAHPVANHFFAAWQRNGWEAGVLKYPTTDEIVNPDNIGRRQEFQGGTVYWRLNEAYYVTGTIRDKWNTVGSERAGSLLGYPTSDEIRLPDGQGRMNRFERGVIYWSPNRGAFPVVGQILDQWSRAGYERSSYSYPTGDAITNSAGTAEQQFVNGRIHSAGLFIPIAPNISLSLGFPSSTPLQVAAVPNGVTFNGPGFSAGAKRTATDGSFELSFKRENAQAPSSFKTLLGVPAGYTIRTNSTRIEIVSSTGGLVAGIGIPMGFDATGNRAPTTANLAGNELNLQFGGATAFPVEAVSMVAASGTLDQWWSTGIQLRQVCEANPIDCGRTRNERGVAYDRSRGAFPEVEGLVPPAPGQTERRPATEDNRVDAARHCMWLGLMTEGGNADFARQMGAAHERDGATNPLSTVQGSMMDQYNNKTGIAVGLRNEGNEGSVINTCIQYARDARIVPDPSTISLANPNGNDLIALKHPQ